MIQQVNQDQLCVRLRIDPQFDGFISLAQLDQSKIVPTEFSDNPRGCVVEPMRTRLLVRPRRQRRPEVRIGPQRHPTNRGSTGITMPRMPAFRRPPAAEPSAVKIRRVMCVTGYARNKNRHWRRRQLNVLSACRCRASWRQTDYDPVHRIMISSVNWPAILERKFPFLPHSRGPRPEKKERSYSSAGSSPSASRSGEPARICSAIRPEFWRIAASILAVMSGLALRKAFEFSRPWPSLWLS